MMNDTYIWLERLASLHKSQMRKAASAEGLQLVHVDVLQYVALCNRYSNTAQALTDYLGQTKGSISQSLKLIESMGYLKREADSQDKRISRLFLTSAGGACLQRIRQSFAGEVKDNANLTNMVKQLLQEMQRHNQFIGFGQCKSCRFNTQTGNGEFVCGLTKETLTKNETLLLCKEHEFADEVN